MNKALLASVSMLAVIGVAHADTNIDVTTKKWFVGVDQPDLPQCKEEKDEDELKNDLRKFVENPPPPAKTSVIFNERSPTRIIMTQVFSALGMQSNLRVGWFKSHDECVSWAPPSSN